MNWVKNIWPTALTPGFRSGIYRDVAIAVQGLAKVHQLLPDSVSSWHRENVERAEIELSIAKKRIVEGRLRQARHCLDDALYWLGSTLIAFEPEYLQALFGRRPLVNQLFWRWDHSMSWGTLHAIPHRQVLRRKRLQLYRRIQDINCLSGSNHRLLEQARQYLANRECPTGTDSLVARIQLAYLDEGFLCAEQARP